MGRTERRLWQALRGGQIDGFRFRRQHSLGPYVADFACLEARLVVEVDGPQHGEDAHRAHDEERPRWLTAEGYRVVRFWVSRIDDDLPAVLDEIHRELSARANVRERSPPPRRARSLRPSPIAGRQRRRQGRA